MSFTVIEDGDSLQIRATISDAKELGGADRKAGIEKEWVEGACLPAVRRGARD